MKLNKNKYLLKDEVKHLEHVLESFLEEDERNCLLIYVALKTGARAQEILNIKKEDLNKTERSVFIHGLKGSNDREIPIPKKLFDKLWNMAQKQEGQHVFGISYSRLVQIWDQYRPVHKKFHSLRHTFALAVLEKTKNIRLVQHALGHRSMMSTTVYTEYLFSQAELRKLLL